MQHEMMLKVVSSHVIVDNESVVELYFDICRTVNSQKYENKNPKTALYSEIPHFFS